MKRLPIYTFLALAMVCGTACHRNQQQMDKNEKKKPTSFATAEEAANKAKSDLLAVLRSGKNISLGLDGAAIEKSQPATPIKHYQLTFDNLLSAATFSNLTQNELATVVPLVADNNVVTIAEVAKGGKGWRVAGLADKSISNDLNMLRRAIGETSQGEITMYDLPHSPIKVYGVKKDNAEMFYTDYPGFSIREGVPTERLLPLLKRDAAEFQREYGDALKKQQLVR